MFIALRLPFESAEARKVNAEIMETIYFAALTTSNELAKVDGPYSSFKGSPTSKGTSHSSPRHSVLFSFKYVGIFQFDMWGVTPSERLGWDWEALRSSMITHGLRNSLLIAPMPTASTSQILGNNECFEPYTSNVSQFTSTSPVLLSALLPPSLPEQTATVHRYTRVVFWLASSRLSTSNY